MFYRRDNKQYGNSPTSKLRSSANDQERFTMNNERLTSEEMERLVLKLDFRQFPSECPQRVFENTKFDAALLLPRLGKEPFARTDYLITLHNTVTEKGIVDEQTFEKMVSEVRHLSEDNMVRVW
jgi:hypothetical protein